MDIFGGFGEEIPGLGGCGGEEGFLGMDVVEEEVHGRKRCGGCNRAISVCLCDSFPNPRICPSRTSIVILQHPEELGEAYATVPLITSTLEGVEVVSGRKFNAQTLPPRLTQAASEAVEKSASWRRTVLLWPSPESETLDANAGEGGLLGEFMGADEGYTVVLMDGTWAAAQHMFNKSPLLQSLRRIQVHPLEESIYKSIRLGPEPRCRSTLEALADVLLPLEGKQAREALIKPLVKMVGIQVQHIAANGGPRTRQRAQKKGARSSAHDDGPLQQQEDSPASKRAGDAGDGRCGRMRGGGDGGGEEEEFASVRKNKTAVLSFLVRLAQRIEVGWGQEAERMRLLEVYRDCLLDLQGDEDDDLMELGRLGPKMKTLTFSLDHFLKMALPVERKHTRGLKDHEFLIETDDRDPLSAQKVPLTVVLDNLRSAFNVGSVFRTSECLGVERIVLCGYTATPEDQQTQRSAMGTDKFVQWEWQRSTLEAIRALKGCGLRVIALETVRGKPFAHEYAFPREGCALLLGNERHGLEADVLAECDEVVQIPCVGAKNSLNVAVAFGMCAYEIVRQWR